jgi:hypothetical protein
LVKIEADGDLHIALADAATSRASLWLKSRRIRSGRKLKIAQPPIITVIGNAFFDIGHASADHSNQRTDLQGYAAWEIPSRHETDSSVIRKHETGFASLQPFRGYSLYGGGNRLQVAV